MTQRKARARRKGVRRASEKLNAAEEAFCQHYVVHRNASEAYRSAVPSAERKRNQTVAEQASRWRAKRKVRARIAELEKNLAEKAERRFGITTDWVLQRYAAIGGASVEDFVKIDAKGQPYIDIAKADNVALRGLAGIEITRREVLPPTVLSGEAETDEPADDDGSITTKIKLRLPERTAALRQLGQHLGMWKSDNEATTVNINLSQRLERALERKALKRKRS